MSACYQMKRNTLRYLRDTAAATAIAFALVIPVVITAAGLAIDMSSAYMVKQRLTHALDAAALAAAASANSGGDIVAKVNQFFDMNYPPEKIGAAYDLVVTQNGDDITVSANATYDTLLGGYIGIDVIGVSASSTVTREVLGLEVALVLDVTGSMSTNNNISALRTASTNFLNILCRGSTCSSLIKIGIVPFSTSVNVGPYGLGRTPGGAVYDTAFVSNPNNLTFNQSNNNGWWGCILERPYPQDTQNGDSSWRWNMYWDTSVTNRNTGCNKAYILPMTNVKSTIQSKINGLTASGNTLSNVGMVWGYRLLSPEFPFREGSAWGDITTKKVAILMTDGDNNIGNTSSYSAYGKWNVLRLTDTDLDNRLGITCTNMKNDGITIYTVVFTSGISQATKDRFKACATDDSKYYYAPSQAGLVSTFEQISRELANIHIKE
jgi:Flp pilus assembly protein TadG